MREMCVLALILRVVLCPVSEGRDIDKELPASSVRYFFYLYPSPETIEISLVSFTFFC